MEKKYIIALDQGTTSSRAIVFDREQKIVGSAQKEFTQFYPKPGWVEHDAVEIYSGLMGVTVEAVTHSGIDTREIAGVGLTNQRETEKQGVRLPVCGIAGDQQAALFGQTCFDRGEAKNTCGTGCFLLMNTGPECIKSRNGLVTTVAASPKGELKYALEGSVFVGGASRDGFLMQFQADILGKSVRRGAVSETTALGAACWRGSRWGSGAERTSCASCAARIRCFRPPWTR